MEEKKAFWGISDLSKNTGVPVSTIKFYIRKELLPRPIKTSKTIGYYTHRHLERLRLIKRIQQEQNLPLDRIREVIDEAEERTNVNELDQAGASSKRREHIIETAENLFREKGYERTTITDIVSAARIGRDTFYLNFKNKRQLFIACFRKIFNDHLQDAEKEIKGESDVFTIMKKRSLAFYRAYPKWSDMINLLRGAAANHRDDFDLELEEVVQMYVDSIRKEIEAGVQHGVFREGRSEIFAILSLGMIDYLCYYFIRGKMGDNFEVVMNDALEVLLHGMSARE